MAYETAKFLTERGHRVVVLTSDMATVGTRITQSVHKNSLSDSLKIVRSSILSRRLTEITGLTVSTDTIGFLRRIVPFFDVVHSHEYTTFENIILHHYSRKYNIPYVMQAHGSIPRIGKRFRKWLYDVTFGYNILQDASKVIALTQTEVRQYQSMGVPEEKIAIIPNGINLSEYADLPPKGSFKKRFNIPENNKIILYLGRIHKTKGIDLLVKAYAYLVKSIKYENTCLVIAGPDDGYFAEIKSLSAHLNISDSVLFTGFISTSDKLKALVDADMFVTPSFYGFPVTFLEAGITGTPIVTTSLGDTLDWIEGRAGYVTRPTVHELARAMRAIISNDDLRQQFSRNSRRITQSEFSSARMIDRVEQVYREVAGK